MPKGRKKKVKIDVDTEIDKVPTSALASEILKEEVIPEQIALLSIDLGRADLNTIVAKINEIIERLN